MTAISIEGLHYWYRGSSGPAVNGLDLEVPEGSFFGLLGPNGAGKTTTISVICGLLKPNSGNVSVLGKDWKGQAGLIRNSIGLVPQEIALYENLTATENMRFFGQMLGLKSRNISTKTAKLMEQFGLMEHHGKLLLHYSGGMKRRVNLMVALMNRPQILILDEPTVGIDVHSRHLINTYLQELNRNGMTVIYTSHQLDETEKLCDRVCIIDHGKVIAEGVTSELTANGKGLHDRFIELTGKQLRDA